MTDPDQTGTAIVALERAQEVFREARAARRQAMRTAVRTGVPLRDVARAAECSHESVRRLAASDGSTVVMLGEVQYTLTEEQVDVLVYKLAGCARGSFPKDIELLGAGSEWLASAGTLATVLHRAKGDEDADPILLDDRQAFALYQILRLTYTGRPTVLSQLYDVLRDTYGKAGEPHVIAALARNRPRKR